MEGSNVHMLHCWTCYMFTLAWPSVLWASVTDQMRRASQCEVCVSTRGTHTRKTGALLRLGSVKRKGMFFLLSGT